MAIDAAMTSGIAVLSPGKECGSVCLYRPILYGKVKTTTTDIVDVAILRALQAIGGPNLRLVVEYPYFGENAHSALMCCAVATRWETVAQLAGLRVDLVEASTWQTQQLGRCQHGKRAQRKQLARSMVRGIFGLDVTQDEADALCMAVWALRAETSETGVLCRPDETWGGEARRVRW